MTVAKNLAVIRAIDAFQRCLPKHLPEILDELEIMEPGLTLPPPDKYHLALSADGPGEAITNAHVAVWVYQAGPSREGATISNTPTDALLKQRTYIECRIAYNTMSSVSYTPAGYPNALAQKDVLARRGYYYIAGIIDAVNRHICCESEGAITDVIGISDDFAGAIFSQDGQQWGGIAQVVFELEQHVTVPFCA